MKKKIIIATANKGKIRELQEIFANSDYEALFLPDFPELSASLDIQENATTFEGNALIKALIVGERSGVLTLADDSGLCVPALNGAPGVYSARYSGKGTDLSNIKKLLDDMSGLHGENRDCYYNCTVAIYDPKTSFVKLADGEWYGRVSEEARGTNSFGYAPIFMCNEFEHKKTNAELEPADLVEINHRGKAFRSVIKILDEYYAV